MRPFHFRVVLVALLSLSVATASKGWDPSSFPNPNTDVDKCGRKGVKSAICDPDGVISYESANVAEGVIKKIYNGESPFVKAPCGSSGLQGYQVAVALMREMGNPGSDAAATAERYAKALHNKWGVGHPDCNNGVLIFLAIKDRQVYISTARGTKDILNFDTLGNIINDAKPALKQGDYNAAVERLVTDVGLALAGKTVKPKHGGANNDDWIATGIFFGIVAAIIGFSAYNAHKQKRRYTDCKSKLEKLRCDQASVRANSYNATSCPICLEDFADDTSGPAKTDGAAPSALPMPEPSTEASLPESNTELRKPLLSSIASPTATAAAAGVSGGSASALSAAEGAAASAAPSAGGSAQTAFGISAGDSGMTPALAAGADADSDPSAPPLPTAAEAKPVDRKPLVLPCGHAFCEPCISKWLDAKKITCPICRRPFDDDDAPPPPNTRDTFGNTRNTHTHDTDANERHGPSSSTAGPSSGDGYGSSRPPCTVDDEEDRGGYVGGTTSAAAAGGSSSGSGIGGSQRPRLRLRWGARRRGIGAMQQDMLMMEMLFRMRMLQRQHPDYISRSMADTWARDMEAGRDLSAEVLRDFQLRDPAVRAANASSGRSGANFSFGGGGGGGGGGRGGSW